MNGKKCNENQLSIFIGIHLDRTLFWVEKDPKCSFINDSQKYFVIIQEK